MEIVVKPSSDLPILTEQSEKNVFIFISYLLLLTNVNK